jgi:ABC-type branched-subunit amino acid transport system ATPase component
VTDAIAVAKQTFGPTMLLVDQDIEVAAGIATRGYFLDQGRVVASGPMRELREVELIRRLYFTADPHEDTNKAVPKEAA